MSYMVIAPIHIATDGMLMPVVDTYEGYQIINKVTTMATQGFIIDLVGVPICPPWIVPVEWIGEWDPDP